MSGLPQTWPEHGADETLLAAEDHIRIRRCRHGLFMFNANDRYIGRSLELYGEFSEGEAALFAQIVRPGMTAIDAGANIGVHTVFLAKTVGPGGRVLAFEPQRVVYQMLCGNIALNGLDNVTACLAALGDRAGSLDVPRRDYRRPGNFGGVSLALPGVPQGAGEPAPVQTLDAMKLGACHFIKIDVEGMERAVIEGARETLARCRPFLYVENDRPEFSKALIESLNRADYRCYWHVPPLFNARNFYGARDNVFGETSSINIFCVPRAHKVALREFVEATADNADRYPLP